MQSAVDACPFGLGALVIQTDKVSEEKDIITYAMEQSVWRGVMLL